MSAIFVGDMAHNKATTDAMVFSLKDDFDSFGVGSIKAPEPGVIYFRADSLAEPMTMEIRRSGWEIDFVNPTGPDRVLVRISRFDHK